MDTMRTQRLPADPDGIQAAASILRAGGLVAFPTETVYGLGAHALDASAVAGIFRAKGRPADDPLIVHVMDAAGVERVARPNHASQELGRHFWPGPLTLVLPRCPGLPSQLTAGLDTVGVRVPSHPVALALLRTAGLPVAAPSANLFGRTSPTRAEHVLEDLDGRIEAVLDGGLTSVGVESTIIDVSSESPRLLRAGGLPAEDVEAVLGVRLLPPPQARHGPQPAPGLLPMHYAPRTPLTLVTGGGSAGGGGTAAARARLVEAVRAATARGQHVGVLSVDEDLPLWPENVQAVAVGGWGQAEIIAARLFDALRRLDALGPDVLFARDLADPDAGLGRALADRLRRAARHVIET
jgi:L-threonylcarbamoyladenylate synthase